MCFLHLFSLGSWADFHCYDWWGYGALLSRQHAGTLCISWAGSLTSPRWAGTSPALKQQGLNWQGKICFTSHLCLISAPHNPRRWKCFGGFGFGLFVFQRSWDFHISPWFQELCTVWKEKLKQSKANANRQHSFYPPKMLLNVLLPPVPRRWASDTALCCPHGRFFGQCTTNSFDRTRDCSLLLEIKWKALPKPVVTNPLT